jgi:hypothetical protein
MGNFLDLAIEELNKQTAEQLLTLEQEFLNTLDFLKTF